MAADDLFFQRTGEEAGPLVLVRLLGDGAAAEAEAFLQGAGTADDEAFEATGALSDVLREARDHALLRGLDLRIDLGGHAWPDTLGILGNADR